MIIYKNDKKKMKITERISNKRKKVRVNPNIDVTGPYVNLYLAGCPVLGGTRAIDHI